MKTCFVCGTELTSSEVSAIWILEDWGVYICSGCYETESFVKGAQRLRDMDPLIREMLLAKGSVFHPPKVATKL